MWPRDLNRFALGVLSLVLLLSPACSKKGPPPKSDEDIDDVYSEDRPDTDSDSDSESDDESGGSSGNSTDGSAGRPAKTKSPEVADPEAVKIIKKLRTAYAKCRTYTDEGEVVSNNRSTDDDEEDGYKSVSLIRTNFARPDCLRVEMDSTETFQGQRICQIYWFCGDQANTSDGLGRMLAGLMGEGTDGGGAGREEAFEGAATSSIVPELLLPKLVKKKKGRKSRTTLDGFNLPQLVGEEKIDTHPCYKISGPIKAEDVTESLRDVPFISVSENLRIETTMTLWIDKKEMVLRRIQQKVRIEDMGDLTIPGAGAVEIPDRVIDVTTTLRPVMNGRQTWSDVAFGASSDLNDPEIDGSIFCGETFKPYGKDRKAARTQARSHVNAMRKKYAECKSYVDSGVMTLAGTDRHDPSIRRVNYVTAFKRAGNFRTLLTHKNAAGDDIRYLAWSDGSEFKDWFSESDQEQTYPNGKNMVDEMVFFHNMPGRLISGLLSEDVFGVSEAGTIKSPILLGDETIDGSLCHVVQGRSSLSAWIFLWIDKKSKHIRRLEMRDPGSGMQYWITLEVKKATFDKKVSAKKLSYKERGD